MRRGKKFVSKLDRHPLIARQSGMLRNRSLATADKMAGLWALSWTPGGEQPGFLDAMLRPLGRAMAVVVSSTKPKRGLPPSVAVCGYATTIDPARGVACVGGLDNHAVYFDLGRDARIGAAPPRFDPTRRPRLFELAMAMDSERELFAKHSYNSKIRPTLPTLYAGLTDPPTLVDTPTLRIRVAQHMQRPVEALAEMEPSTVSALLAAEWRNTVVAPRTDFNKSRHWIVPLSCYPYVRNAAQLYESFSEICGAELPNPVPKLRYDRVRIENPVNEVIARVRGMDWTHIPDASEFTLKSLQDPDGATPDEQLKAFHDVFLELLGDWAPAADSDTLLAAVLTPDEPLRLGRLRSPLSDFSEAEVLRLMRARLGKLSAAVTDGDLRDAAADPNRPLVASGLAAVQVLHGPLAFTTDTQAVDFAANRWRK